MKKLQSAFIAALFIQLVGCISYSHNQQADAQIWPISTGPHKNSITLKVDTEYEFNGVPAPSKFNLPLLEDLLVKEYKSSLAFDRVTVGREPADVFVQVKVSNHETGSVPLSILTGITLFVIPGSFDNEWIMETRFFDASGTERGLVIKREKTTTWMQALLIFAIPFNQSTDPILAKLARSTLEEAKQRNLL